MEWLADKSNIFDTISGDQMLKGIKVSEELGIYDSQEMCKDIGWKFYESEYFEIMDWESCLSIDFIIYY